MLPLQWAQEGKWFSIDGGELTPDQLAGLALVVEVKLKAVPVINATLGVHPKVATVLPAAFASIENAVLKRIGWMEKFGEWKHVEQVGEWKMDGIATWVVDVAQAGTSGYHTYPFGLFEFKKPGKHSISVHLVEGDRETSSLKSIRLIPVN